MTGNDLEKEMLLLERIKKDKSLFDELYNSLYNQVYRYCLALTNHIQDAEDIASRTFLELYQKIDVFVWEEKPIKLWLFKTARYLYLNKIRKIEPSESFDEEMAVLDHHEITFVDEIIQKDLIKIVKKEISRLPTAQREVIELKLLEELQFNEIAEIVGKNENTCKTIFYRGIKNLKQTLNKDFRYKDLSIPILLTSIVQSLGQGDLSLSKPVILENIINKPQNMNQILTSKALITVIVVSSTAIAAVIGVTVYNSQSSQKDNSKQEQKVEQTDQAANATPITQTPSVTDIPISTPTSSPSPTPSNTVTPTPTAKKPTPTPIPDLVFTSAYGYTITVPGNLGYSIKDGSDPVYGGEFTNIRRGDAGITLVHIETASGRGVACPCTRVDKSVTNVSGKVVNYWHITSDYQGNYAGSFVDTNNVKALNPNIVTTYMSSTSNNLTLLDSMMNDVFKKLK